MLHVYCFAQFISTDTVFKFFYHNYKRGFMNIASSSFNILQKIIIIHNLVILKIIFTKYRQSLFSKM